MAKKFFFDKVYNTKKTIINLIIIGVCIIGIIICFIITSNFQGENKNQGELNIKSDVTVEVNEEFSKEIFFSKIENVDLNKITITYPDNFNKALPGEYEITITVNKKDYSTKLIIVDTMRPELELQDLTIIAGSNYKATDFVKSCIDNSGQKCIIEFYQDGVDEDGKAIDYANYTKEGVYPIKISAKDESGNQNVLETNLTIQKKEVSEKPPVTIPTCKYGNNVYDNTSNILALDVTSGGCAISLDFYNKNTEIDKIMETETTRIIKDIQKLNLKGTPYVNREVSAITNLTGNGIVGFQLEITFKIENDNNSEIIAQYKLDINGKRIYSVNKYNLAN